MRGPNGALIPATENDGERVRALKPGRVYRMTATEVRNGPKFRRWWILVQYAFDLWSEHAPKLMHKGQPVRHELERFRKDITVMAGYCYPVFNALGEMRLEPESIAWGSMTDERFSALYSATIDVLLGKVLGGTGLTDEQLREHVERVLSFD